jgi:hypothetical protein
VEIVMGAGRPPDIEEVGGGELDGGWRCGGGTISTVGGKRRWRLAGRSWRWMPGRREEEADTKRRRWWWMLVAERKSGTTRRKTMASPPIAR